MTGDSTLTDYFFALERLVRGKPIRVSPGTKITNDAVALEAGRKKGSIKRSRGKFTKLIGAIHDAAKAESSEHRSVTASRDRAVAEAKSLRSHLEAALGREISLIKELYDVKRQLLQLNNASVIPIRGRNAEQLARVK
jgi:hypothetical protein